MILNEHRTIGGSTKTEAKTCHSGTVNRWAAIVFAHLVALIFSTVTEVCIPVQITRHGPAPHRLYRHTYIAV